MLPYYFLFAFLGICSIFDFNKKHLPEFKLLYALTFFILLLFVGLRHNIGIDIYEYESYFNSVENNDFSWTLSLDSNEIVSKLEIGYYLINFLLSKIENFQLFIFTITIFNLFALYFYVNKVSIEHKFTFFAILFSFTLFREFDVVRQSIALHIFLISLIYYDKPKKYYFINLVGASFHISAIIFLIIYPLIRITFSKASIYIIFILYLLTFFYQIPFLKVLINLIEPISDAAVFRSLISFFTYLNYPRQFAPTIDIPCLILLVILITKYNYYSYVSGHKKIMINIFLISIINIIIFSEITEVVTRVSYYFYFGIAGMFTIFYGDLKNKFGKLISIFPLIFVLAKLFFMMQSEAPRVSYTPYSNYLINTDEYSYSEYLKRKSVSGGYYLNAIDAHQNP